MNKQILKKGIAILSAVIMVAVLFSGCSNKEKLLHDKEYNNTVNAYAFWDNDIENAIPQTMVRRRINDFLNTPSSDGKKKKVLFLGYDGCRADRLTDILDTQTSEAKTDRNSGILETLNDDRAGLYLAYAGGNKDRITEQSTVTGAGWASLTTGVWKNKHKININKDTKNPKYRTFVLDGANGDLVEGQKLSTVFISNTAMHFATQYIDEINYLYDNPKPNAQMPKKLEHKDFVIKETQWTEKYDEAMLHDYVKSVVDNTSVSAKFIYSNYKNAPEEYGEFGVYYGDYNTAQSMINEINNGTDIVFGIIDATDVAGHKFGFSKENQVTPEYIKAFEYSEKLSKEVITAAKQRAKDYNEDWLIIMTTDHGGYNKKHGQQSFEERTIWVACNQGFDEKYMSKSYDGFIGKLKTKGY